MYSKRSIKLQSLLVFLSLLYSVPALAKPITVTVQDVNGNNISGIAVHLESNDGKQHTIPSREITVYQKDKKFSPYLTVKSTADKLIFENLDNITHHIYTVLTDDFSFRLKKNEKSADFKINKAGDSLMACNIHDWMAGYIYTVDSPYFGITGEDGSISFEVPDDADFNAVIWHPQLANSDQNRSQPVNDTNKVLIKLTGEMTEIPNQENPESFEFLDDY